MPKVSVCICTMNRPKELKGCLESIQCSTIKPYEVIVSDDSDQKRAKESKKIALSFKEVKYRRGPKKNQPSNRNNCLKYVAPNTKFITFIDDDARIGNRFLENALTCLRKWCSYYKTDRIVVTGTEKSLSGQKLIPRNLSFLGFYDRPRSEIEEQDTICMNSVLFPSELFRMTQWDENQPWCTERDITSHFLYLGFRIIYCPDVINLHPTINPRVKDLCEEEMSRLYFGLKRYWLYKRSILRFLLFVFYAPLNSLGGRVIGFRLRALPIVAMSYLRAWKLFLIFRRTIISSRRRSRKGS